MVILNKLVVVVVVANLATVTVLFPVPGYKSMRQRNLSPDQKDIRVSQLLLKSFQETNRSAGLGGG